MSKAILEDRRVINLIVTGIVGKLQMSLELFFFKKKARTNDNKRI
jgi:hypothetical protein